MIKQVIPAIMKNGQTRIKNLIQQDNAPSHIDYDNHRFVAAAKKEGGIFSWLNSHPIPLIAISWTWDSLLHCRHGSSACLHQKTKKNWLRQ